MDVRLDECSKKSQIMLENLNSVMNAFEKQNEEIKARISFDESNSLGGNRPHTAVEELQGYAAENKLSSKLSVPAESELWSADSKPVTFAKSQESNECDFQYVETVLPKLSNQAMKRSAEYDDDCLSDGSQSHTVFTIAKLVSNLNKQKEENKQLQEEIACLKSEVEVANMRLQIEQCQKDDVGELSALTEEIRNAEQERESAVLSRLKLAIQERDQAQVKVKAYFDSGSEKIAHNKQAFLFNDKRLLELLDSLCHSTSARAVEKHGNSIIALLLQMKKEHKKVSEQEMKALALERDQALHQCLNLKEELKDIKSEVSKPSSTAHQHDQPSEKEFTRTDSPDVDLLRLNYSLLRSFHERVYSDDAERLVEALRITEEHSKIQEANHRRSEEQIKMLHEKNQRLERLVKVLRNKLASMAMR